MNLTAGAADAGTVGAFGSGISAEADPAGHCHTSRPYLRASADVTTAEAPTTRVGRRQDNPAHQRPAVAMDTLPAHDAPHRANGARHPERVSVHIHPV